MIYRQRLTPAGWIGAALFVVGPAAFGAMYYGFSTAPGYGQSDGILVIASALLAPIGAVMLLTGREYYDATDEAAMEVESRERDADEAARRKSSRGF